MQEQVPFWQLLPLPQVFPHAPQFWLSVCTFVHEPPHAICPVLQLGPLAGAGVAQLATKSAKAGEIKKKSRMLNSICMAV